MATSHLLETAHMDSQASPELTPTRTSYSEPHLSRCLAATLPDEMLDQIMQALPHDWGAEREHYRVASRVCHSWRKPAQRYLFHIISLESVKHANVFAAAIKGEGSRLTPFVKTLSIQFSPGIGETWSVEDLEELLGCLPALSELILSLNSAGPCAEDFENMNHYWRHLKEVILHIKDWDPKLDAARQILKRTPNITSLTIGSEENEFIWGRHQVPRLDDAYTDSAPLELPYLATLTLRSSWLCRVFDRTNLLSDSTLNQLVCLQISDNSDGSIGGYYDEDEDVAELPDLSEVFGTFASHIQALHISAEYMGSQDIHDLILSCSSLKLLSFERRWYRLVETPPSLTTVRYSSLLRTATRTETAFFLDPFLDEGNVTRVEFENFAPEPKWIDFLVAKGIHVFVDGIVHRHLVRFLE